MEDKLKRELEEILQAKGDDRATADWIMDAFHEALGAEVPDATETEFINGIFNAVMGEYPIGDALIISFQFGRQYERKKRTAT